MSYPGNTSLAAEIQERIVTTFEHTLDLAARGELREAGVGCDFILKLDPSFEPASRLKERLEQGEGSLLVDDLRLVAAETSSPTAAEEDAESEDLRELLELDDEVDEEVSGDDVDEAPPPGLITAPADTDETPVFSDLEADELEAALDLSALSDSEATAGSPDGLSQSHDVAAADEEAAGAPAADAPNGDRPEGGEPVAALDSETEDRIQELLGEGQSAFEEGNYQSAIDAWSRIFLIDIDHPEASRRIELARKLKAEVERQVEELFHDGVSQVESGRFDEARESFSKVIEMQGSHLAAQEYLDKLESGAIKEEAEGGASDLAAPALEDIAPAATPGAISELDAVPGEALELPADLEVPAEALAEPKERPRRPRPARPAPKPAKPKGLKRSFLYIGGAVLVLAIAGSWFLYRNFDDTFPNAGQQGPPATATQVDVIARAQQVQSEGNTELAIAQLKRIPPNHPRYAEAQALIAQWETREVEEAAPATISAEQLAERDRLIDAARSAFDNRRFLSSHRLLTQAAAIAELSEEGVQLQTAAALELQPLRSEIEIFRQGEWAQALRGLWELQQSNPANPDVRQLMVDSYYNLAVRDLQRRDPAAATENLEEALKLAEDDLELERLARFAEIYEERSVDLLYRIFVKYLPFR